MKWELTEPKLGNIIRVKVGPLYHYGVYINDDEIIQFGLNPLLRQGVKESDIEVCISDINDFLNGGFLEVGIPDLKEKLKANKPKKAVELAKSRLGEKGYTLLHNNCEHFAYECVMGYRYCSQTDNVRNMFRNFGIADLYTAPIPENDIGEVLPKERQTQINCTNNQNLKRQRYYVWKLLEYALNRSFGYKIADLNFSKNDNGKWSCKECYFSLSHTDTAVCVAVSRKPIGVDIERLAEPKSDSFAKKILTANEYQEYFMLTGEEQKEYVIKKWCEKESIFKQGNDECFIPNKLSASNGTVSGKTEINGEEFCYALTSPDAEKLRIYNTKLG